MIRARPPKPSIEGTRPLKLLGAIIAGGQARRFGSDKAYARYHGQRLIDLVGRALA
ncbi:MAG TPA: NTP transferase domain-containing protein, partial [Erythrobacter sp.]|nr:NTP transferase domain-containing protein [Erythrobacter sp.]